MRKQILCRKGRALSRNATSRLSRCHAVVIGAGAMGRQVAILLASLGVKHLSLYDPRIICRKDLSSGFLDFDVGLPAVDAVANIAHQYHPQMELLTYPTSFNQTHITNWKPGLQPVAFFCNDSASIRQSSWKWLGNAAHFLCDGRVSAHKISVRSSDQPAMHSENDLVSIGWARNPSRMKAIDVVSSSLAATLMVLQFTRWVRRQRCISILQFDRVTCELTVENPSQ